MEKGFHFLCYLRLTRDTSQLTDPATGTALQQSIRPVAEQILR
jgi:hypothetical protein